MTATEEGIENLEVRTKWPNEALDFTPWLAQNLNLLGDELGIRLELVQQEKAVGPMSLDILARDTDTKDLVAIENQLEWTDTPHLGQLLTYATGCDAHVAIWVATEFRHEYAKALHRLNEWTSDRAEVLWRKDRARQEEQQLMPRAQVPQGGIPRRLEQGHHAAH